MPLDPNLAISYSGTQASDTSDALTLAKTTLETVVGAPLNLSSKERGETPSVDVQRTSFVTDAIVNLAPLYPNLLGPEIDAGRAVKLWDFRNTSLGLLAEADAYRDMLTDVILNAENICLKFTEDLRDNAMRFKDRNVPGADVVWDRLKDLHTRTDNPDEPTPPGS